MREILFRGIIKSDNSRYKRGQWAVGDLVRLQDGKDGKPHIYGCGEVFAETIGQYTGLTDKNGNKIFEGDVVKSDDLYGEPLSVIFNENCGTFQVLFKDGYSEGFLEQYTDVNHLEVIGNITDNPELLKEREQNG